MKPASLILKSYLALSYGLLLSLGLTFCQSEAHAASTNETDVPAADMAILENRFFSHSYDHDPLEKRLERLECMIYGGVQDGSNLGRLNKMKKTVAERSAMPLKAEAQPQAATTEPGQPNKAQPSGQGQYPVLNTLEWRALKKTYPNESLDQRLERIETKLFGLAAPSMAYVDRVERLKKTLGIGLPQASGPVIAGGPMPKARPRSPMQQALPFEFDQMENNFQPNAGGFPEMSFGFGFHSDIVNHVNQMFADMNKQMSNLSRLGPGSWTYDPKQGVWVEMYSGRKVKPGQQSMELLPENETGQPRPRFLSPKSAPARPAPAMPRFNTPSNLPAYSDPNAI